jgi:phage terminase large subunit
MPIPFQFDFKNPDYLSVFRYHAERLKRIRANPSILPALKVYYKENPAQFITDWGVTFDPRNVERGLPAAIPFLLFPKQEEWVQFILDCWKKQEPGATGKSREMGVTWLAVALSCTLCLLHPGMAIGFGSRKQEYVDKLGDPKCILYKAREFMKALPKEFRGGWDPKKHAPHMRIHFPETSANITGEAGDGIGRGDRVSIEFIDEAAWLEHPELIEASLSQTTNCRQDISTPHGMGNPFANKMHSGRIKTFTFHWREDPRKDQAWYDKKCHEIDNPVIVAQEIDMDYSASLEGVLIPAIWVQAAIDAHERLGIVPTGLRHCSLDVADEGIDENSFCGKYGILIEDVHSWSGKNSDIYQTVQKVFALCDVLGYFECRYDANGLGAGVRGDSKQENLKRTTNNLSEIFFLPFDASGAVINPEGDPNPIVLPNGTFYDKKEKTRTNEDFFLNAKSQAWWHLRRLFQMTYRAVIEKLPYCPDEIISLSSKMPELNKLVVELSQPTYDQNSAGKILINKKPDGQKSPNRADALMIACAPKPPERMGFWS